MSVVTVLALLVGCAAADPAPPETPTSDGHEGPAEQTPQPPATPEAPTQAAPAQATTCSTEPDLGLSSPVRKAMFDAVRVPVEDALKQSVIFKVIALRAKSGWALLTAQPLRPDGSRVDYRNTAYQQAIDLGAFDDQVDTLVRYEPSIAGTTVPQTNAGTEVPQTSAGTKVPQCAWKVYEWEIGSTDVAWVAWGSPKYDVPEEVIPREKP